MGVQSQYLHLLPDLVYLHTETLLSLSELTANSAVYGLTPGKIWKLKRAVILIVFSLLNPTMAHFCLLLLKCYRSGCSVTASFKFLIEFGR